MIVHNDAAKTRWTTTGAPGLNLAMFGRTLKGGNKLSPSPYAGDGLKSILNYNNIIIL